MKYSNCNNFKQQIGILHVTFFSVLKNPNSLVTPICVPCLAHNQMAPI